MSQKELKGKIIEILRNEHLGYKSVNNDADQILQLFSQEKQKWIEEVEKIEKDLTLVNVLMHLK